MGSRVIGFVALLAACGKGEVDDCKAGFELRDDGLCYEQAAATEVNLDALLDAFPECELGEPNGAMDLVAYCAGPGCAGDTFAELEEAYGPGECGSIGYGRSECYWAEWDVVGNYLDDEADGVIADDQLATGLWVGAAFPGGTEDGLAPNSSIRCYVDVLGLPTWMEPVMDTTGTDPWFAWWAYDFGAFFLVDRFDSGNNPGGDGIPEYLWLNGPG
jgi:hypothetical protein